MILLFLLTHVLTAPKNDELIIVETSDGSIHGIDPSQGSSLWSVLTGPPIISYTSEHEPFEFEISSSGEIYITSRTSSESLKLPFDAQTIVSSGPFRYDPFPDLIIYGNKNTQILRVNICDGEFFLENFGEKMCPSKSSPYDSNFFIGRIDYSLFALNEATNQLIWTGNYSKFTSLSNSIDRQRPALSVYGNDKLVVKTGTELAWSKKFANNIVSIHKYSSEKYSLEGIDIEYLLEERDDFYLYFFFICLLACASYSGFLFGKRYVNKDALVIQQVPISSPRHSRASSESEKPLALCPCDQPKGSIMKFMLNPLDRDLGQIFNDNQSLKEHAVSQYDIAKENFSNSEYERISKVKNNELIIEETYKTTSSYLLESTEHPSISLLTANYTRKDEQITTNFHTYPKGDFAEIIRTLDTGNYRKKFEKIKLLGRGGFSEVHLAKHKLDDQYYAIKIVRIEIAEKQPVTSHKLFSEVKAIKTLQSRYIVRYITCWVEFEVDDSIKPLMDESSLESSDSQISALSSSNTENYMPVLLHIQMEYCSGITLRDWLDRPGREICRVQVYEYFYQLLKGIKHIHERGIIHRDLKPANIFMHEEKDGEKEEVTLKIGDFNLATFLYMTSKNGSFVKLQRRTRNTGTPLYLAPEQSTYEYSNKVDIYPLGIILLELCYKYSTYHELHKCLRLVSNKNDLPDEIKKSYPVESEVILLFTRKDPEQRPEAAEFLKSELIEKWRQEVGIEDYEF